MHWVDSRINLCQNLVKQGLQCWIFQYIPKSYRNGDNWRIEDIWWVNCWVDGHLSTHPTQITFQKKSLTSFKSEMDGWTTSQSIKFLLPSVGPIFEKKSKFYTISKSSHDSLVYQIIFLTNIKNTKIRVKRRKKENFD